MSETKENAFGLTGGKSHPDSKPFLPIQSHKQSDSQKEKLRLRMQKLRADRQAAGMCTDCQRKPKPGTKYCYIHLVKHQTYNIRHRMKGEN